MVVRLPGSPLSSGFSCEAYPILARMPSHPSTAKRTILALLVALSVVLGLSPPAAAQAPRGFMLDRYPPSERGSEWFAVDTLDFRGRLRPAVGLIFDYARKPLVIYNEDGTERNPIVSDQAYLHL